jgi:hypothetical protein
MRDAYWGDILARGFMKRISNLFLMIVTAAVTFAADAPATFKVSTFTFARPAKWEWIETTSTMRKAQLKVVDTKSGKNAEVIFFYFGPGDGGGTKANVERWFSQFEEPRERINAKTEEATIGGHKVTYVHAEGTYRSGMPGGPTKPMAGYALTGAIIEDPQGSIFVRMTGPKELVKESDAEFKKLIASGLK